MIIVAEAVAANAATIAIWLMNRACFGRPLVGMVVNFTVGEDLSFCVICGDCRGCRGIKSLTGMWSGLRWMAGTSPGVLFVVFC